MKKVLIFGVFDGVHDGHRFLFAEARKHGDHLAVAVAQDAIVEQLKGHAPRRLLAERMEALHAEPLVDEVLAGDVMLGSYEVIKKYDPHIVALGYDQKALKKDLEAVHAIDRFFKAFEIVVIGAHHPEALHSAILERKKKDR